MKANLATKELVEILTINGQSTLDQCHSQMIDSQNLSGDDSSVSVKGEATCAQIQI